MANYLWKVDSKTFMRLFVIFNVSLAVYNFLSFRIGGENRTPMAPCVLVVSSDNQNNEESPGIARVLDLTTIKAITTTIPQPKMAVTEATPNATTFIKPPEMTRRGQYFALTNYIPANRTYIGEESVTLTTQGTFNFLKHSILLCKRWDGPISISVYVGSGGRELTRALKVIGHLRRCNACVYSNVTWHFIFESDGVWHVPKNATFERRLLKAGMVLPTWEEPDQDYNCTAMEASTMNFKNFTREAPRKVGRGYPINVARNVARAAATTKYILASDIELYPSTNIIPRFLKMVAQEEPNKDVPHVYVLPIFEVNASEPPPENKTLLVKLLNEKKAIYFHKWTCDSCQNFPGRPTWPNVLPSWDSLSVHTKAKRNRSRNSWEPIYIGTNSDPFYEEALTWEGKRDKMSQMFEMCLMDYTLYILDNAFLVHAPGIKTINSSDEKRRAPFMRKNNVVYQKAVSHIRAKYPNTSKLNC